jgi:hypothetical protein
MLQSDSYLTPPGRRGRGIGSGQQDGLDRTGEKSLEARVKPDCGHLYPGVDPKIWYPVIQEGEYRDDMEGLWIQVSDWVTYVLAKHFDLQARSAMH